ncbi:MAG: DegQ family serine endoprotease [Bryobacterales bacterium]|nr:DegQ family serine endoprotease [Bryobacterales bacterium]
MTGTRMEIKRWVAIAALIAAVISGAAAALAAAKTGLLPLASTGPMFQVAASERPAGSLGETFAPVVKRVLPAVVNIYSERVVRTRAESSPFFADPFFRDFFEQFGWRFDVPREYRQRSLGSGVIVSSDGYILTANHVIHGATDVKVAMLDKREMEAKIVGTDPRTDLALLKVEATGLPFLPLGDSSKLEIGDIVLAIGNPFGIGQTVTMGIVSAKGRSGITPEPNVLEDFIQTDAAINTGNSGGALVNTRGELVGINDAIVSPSGGNVGIGFAIPSNMAKPVMEQLVKSGRVVRGYLGVMIQPVDQKVAKAFNLKEARGALVGDVTADGPAAKAGIQKGDVIVAVNDQRVEDNRDLQLKIASTAPGTRVNLRVIRDGKELTIPVTLGEVPGDREAARAESRRGSALEGVDVDDLTPAIARQLGLPRDTFGVVVTNVRPDSPAAEAGLRRGDVIQEVNRRPVTNVASFERAVRQAGSEPVLLLINRGGNTHFLVVEPR